MLPIFGNAVVVETGKNVTKCIGGARHHAGKLAGHCHTHCDPQSNSDQALQQSFAVVELAKMRHGIADRHLGTGAVTVSRI